MSKSNGEKARSHVAKKRRTAQRVKDRAALAQIKAGRSDEAGKSEKSEKAG